jgi:phage terminase large subunit-like protein
MAKQSNRVWCEDLSPTLKEIRTSKKNGKTITLNGTIYEYVGDNLVFNTKTNRIEKL